MFLTVCICEYTHNYIYCIIDLTQLGWHTLRFKLTLTWIRVHKKRHYIFPFSSKRLLEQGVLLLIAWRIRHFFVRYVALCVISIAKLNISNTGEERILCLKDLISYSSSFYCAYVLKNDNRNTTQNCHCLQHYFSAIRIFSKDTIIKCKPLQTSIVK